MLYYFSYATTTGTKSHLQITRKDAEQPYQRVQEIVLSPTYDLELSAFRFERKPHDPETPPFARPWLVVVLGEQPPEAIEQRLRGILGSGEMTTPPLETVVTLAQRQEQEIIKAHRLKDIMEFKRREGDCRCAGATPSRPC